MSTYKWYIYIYLFVYFYKHVYLCKTYQQCIYMILYEHTYINIYFYMHIHFVLWLTLLHRISLFYYCPFWCPTKRRTFGQLSYAWGRLFTSSSLAFSKGSSRCITTVVIWQAKCHCRSIVGIKGFDKETTPVTKVPVDLPQGIGTIQKGLFGKADLGMWHLNICFMLFDIWRLSSRHWMSQSWKKHRKKYLQDVPTVSLFLGGGCANFKLKLDVDLYVQLHILHINYLFLRRLH